MPNDIKLQEGHPVDEHLRPIKVGGKLTALETAQYGNGCRVNGDLEITDATMVNGNLEVIGSIKGNTTGLGAVTVDSLTTNDIISTDLTIDDSGDITLDAAGGDVRVLQADLHIPIDKKVQFGGSSEHITGDNTDLSIKAAGHVLVTPAGGDSSLKIFAGATEVIQLNTSEGGAGGSIRLNSIADTGDYCKLKTTTAGATTLETVDDDAALASLTLDIDGAIDINSGSSRTITLDSGSSIILDSDNGNFIAKKAGTEFSATNSAYAGMILGCTHVFGSGTAGQFQAVTTAWESLLWDTDKYALVTFVVPPSNKVKINVLLPYNQLSGNFLYLGIATDSSATTLNAKYDNKVWDVDETDIVSISYSWVVDGLDHSWSAGETKTLYIMAYATGNVRLYTGGTNANYYGGVIVEATALPATIGNGEEP